MQGAAHGEHDVEAARTSGVGWRCLTQSESNGLGKVKTGRKGRKSGREGEKSPDARERVKIMRDEPEGDEIALGSAG